MTKKPTNAAGSGRKLKSRAEPASPSRAKSRPKATATAAAPPKQKRKPLRRPQKKPKGSERRLVGRRRLLWLGRLKYSEYAFDCRVFDLSLGGAKVELDLPLKRGTLVTLQIPDVGLMVANVAWARDGKMALAFSEGTAAIRKKLAAKAAKLGLA